MRQPRYGPIEISSAPALGNEITQERPHSRHPLLSRSSGAPSGAFEEERAHLLGVPLLGVIAERLEQLACTAAVVFNGRRCGASMDLEPAAKPFDEHWFVRRGGGRVAGAHAELHQVLVKAPYPEKVW